MPIVGTTRIPCPACGHERDCQIVQSINTRQNPAAKQQLLEGSLNVLACDCGRRTQLAANVLFHDPDADYLCHVVPGGEPAMAQAADAFRAAGATGTQRLVPSLNALIEKIKILDAGLEDWVVEMTKVLLLASLGEHDLDRILLFDRVDRPVDQAGDHEAGLLHWVLFDARDDQPQPMSSPLAAYTRLAGRTHARPGPHERRIDRAWALEAVRTMIAGAN